LDPKVLPPYGSPDVIGVIVVSEDNRRYLNYAFPGLACERLVLSLNYDLFSFVPWHQKRRQIAYMTRKNEDDVSQVVKILAHRGRLADWRLVPIQGLPEEDVARVMRESRLFLAFGHPEGLSLSNLEALACGCRLIGYTGCAGCEYFRSTGSIEIEVGNVIGFCEAVEAFVQTSESLDDQHAATSREAACFVRETYSGLREVQTVVAAMQRFMLSDTIGA
jgi:glycosyltransferase involved in cell wall biosynthesis